jgi:hypothetical protein
VAGNKDVPATSCFGLTPGVGAGRYLRAYPVEGGLILFQIGKGANFIPGVESAPPMGDGGFAAAWPDTPQQVAAEPVLRPFLSTCAGVAEQGLCVVPDMQRACGCCNSLPADCAAETDGLTGGNISLALDWYQRAYLVLPVIPAHTFSLVPSTRTRVWTSIYIGHPAGIHAGEFAVPMPSLPPAPPAAPEAILPEPLQYALICVAGSSLCIVLLARFCLCGPSRPAREVRPEPETAQPEMARGRAAKAKPKSATPELRLKGMRAAPRPAAALIPAGEDDEGGADEAAEKEASGGRGAPIPAGEDEVEREIKRMLAGEDEVDSGLKRIPAGEDKAESGVERIPAGKEGDSEVKLIPAGDNEDSDSKLVPEGEDSDSKVISAGQDEVSEIERMLAEAAMDDDMEMLDDGAVSAMWRKGPAADAKSA